MSRKKPSKSHRDDPLPYTGVLNAGLSIGYTRADLVMMPFGELVLGLQAKADSYGDQSSGAREATQAEIEAWF